MLHRVYLFAIAIKASLALLLLLAAVLLGGGVGIGTDGSGNALDSAALLHLTAPYLLLAAGCVAVPLKFFGLVISDLLDERKAQRLLRHREADKRRAQSVFQASQHQSQKLLQPHTTATGSTADGGPPPLDRAASSSEPSVAGLYQSTHALFAKPLNSVGPILAAFALAPALEFKARQQAQQSLQPLIDATEQAAAASAARAACFWVLVGAPLLTAGWQWFCWRETWAHTIACSFFDSIAANISIVISHCTRCISADGGVGTLQVAMISRAISTAKPKPYCNKKP